MAIRCRRGKTIYYIQIWKKKIKKPLVEINLVSDSNGEQGTDDDTESDYDRMPSARGGETIPEICKRQRFSQGK